MTAATLDDGEFWLPGCFLSEETAAMMVNQAAGVGVGGGRGEKDVRMVGWRKEEFPYEFGMFRSEVCSPVESLGRNESEEDEFFARLTQRLSLTESRNVSPLDLYKSPEVSKGSGGSPQSILGGIGSCSGRSSNGSNHNSPPATPFETQDETLGLIYAAAGQVARLKMEAENPFERSLNEPWRAVAKPNLNQKVAPLPNHKANLYADQQMKRDYMAALFWEHQLQNIRRSGAHNNPRYGANSELLTQSVWPPPQHARVPVKPSFRAVPLQRKESAGTGVFIPRRFDAAAPPRKKAVTPCALVPAKVAQALNTSFETMSGCARSHCNPNAVSMLSQQSYEALMARRQALLDQQQRSTARSEDRASRSLEACLPQEWSY